MNHSRGRPESEDDDDDNKNLGEAWGGESYSIKSGIKIFGNSSLIVMAQSFENPFSGGRNYTK